MRNLIFILFVFFASVSGWGACYQQSGGVPYSIIMGSSVYCSFGQCTNPRYESCSSILLSCGDGCPEVLGTGSPFYVGKVEGNNAQYCSNIGSCGSAGVYPTCFYEYMCTTKIEADSINCVNNGGSWEFNQLNGMYECNTNQCDTTMNCISYPFNRCVDVEAGSEITCVNGQCSGLPGAMFYSEFRQECRNECGDVQTNSITSDTAYVVGASCDDDVKCGAETFCAEFSNGTYFLYKKCVVGRETVGNVNEQQMFAEIEYSGMGSCAENGYSSSKYPNSGNYASSQGGAGSQPSTSDEQPISDDCALYGVGCETYSDTTDYSNPDNQSPSKNCWCEPFDGSNVVSRIVCPDGTSRVVYFSCNEWHNVFKSSSSGSPSGGSSTSGGTSSGSTSYSSDSNPFKGKYPEYPADQPTTNKNVQGALSGMGDILVAIRDKLIEIKNYLVTNDVETYQLDSINLPHGDYSQLDSLELPKISFDSLFNMIDTSTKIIDTSSYVGVGTCPVIMANYSTCQKIPFFRGNSDVDMRIDFSNFSGFNLCTLIKSIVLGFASIVSTLISVKLFLKSGL